MREERLIPAGNSPFATGSIAKNELIAPPRGTTETGDAVRRYKGSSRECPTLAHSWQTIMAGAALFRHCWFDGLSVIPRPQAEKTVCVDEFRLYMVCAAESESRKATVSRGLPATDRRDRQQERPRIAFH